MGINSVLKKEGINIIGELNTLDVNKIASLISEKICAAFPEYNLNQSDLFVAIARLNMYVAEMPNDTIGAKYYYKTSSIYFNKNMDINKLNTLSLHECIHYIQEQVDKRGRLRRLGLYQLGKPGEAINEASVQLMASVANGCKEEEVKYYNMNISTRSPDFYPLETALLKELIYFTGPYPLFHSTLYSNNVFKNTFISKSSKETYNKIVNNFDLLMQYQEKLNEETYKLYGFDNDSLAKVKRINDNIASLKQIIVEKTFDIQNTIIEECFNKAFDNIKTAADISNFQADLYNFHSVIITADNYSFYVDYYKKMVKKLKEKKKLIKQYGSIPAIANNTSTDLYFVEENTYGFSFFKTFFSKLNLVFEDRFRSREY